jgi:hypothetical protein
LAGIEEKASVEIWVLFLLLLFISQMLSVPTGTESPPQGVPDQFTGHKFALLEKQGILFLLMSVGQTGLEHRNSNPLLPFTAYRFAILCI